MHLKFPMKKFKSLVLLSTFTTIPTTLLFIFININVPIQPLTRNRFFFLRAMDIGIHWF